VADLSSLARPENTNSGYCKKTGVWGTNLGQSSWKDICPLNPHAGRVGEGPAAYSVADCPKCLQRQAKHQLHAVKLSACIKCGKRSAGAEWRVIEWFKSGQMAAQWIQDHSMPAEPRAAVDLPTEGPNRAIPRYTPTPRAPNQNQRVVQLLKTIGSETRLYTLTELEDAFRSQDALGALQSCRAAGIIQCVERSRDGPSRYRVDPKGWMALHDAKQE
jgi:hypothetical protein